MLPIFLMMLHLVPVADVGIQHWMYLHVAKRHWLHDFGLFAALGHKDFE